MRSKILLVAVVAALLGLFAAPAGAQDGPTLTVEPATVEAAGDVEFTITGSGWTAAPPIFVLPCEVPEDGDFSNLSAENGCDASNLTPATPDADGNFTVTATYTVADNGIAIAAGDAGQTEAAFVAVTVGAAQEEAPAEEPAEEETLAETGVESGLLAVVALALVAGGAMVVQTNRRHSSI